MDTLADLLFERLAWSAAQATVLIAALWLLVRMLPRLAPAARCALWWLVALQLVLGLALPVPVPVKLPLLAAPPARDPVVAITPSTASHGPVAMAAPQPPFRPTHPIPLAPSRWTPARIAVSCWLLAVLAQLAWLLRQGVLAWRVRRAATTVDDPVLRALCAGHARALGLRTVPALRRSAAIDSPQVGGLVRPVILLPAAQRLDARELPLAIAHELAHVRRGDLYAGWLPALAQRLFFFHPLVGWAMREYALHREAACDAQVIDRLGAAAHDYGRLLVRLGVMPPVSAGLAGASSTFRHLKRRLTMLQQTPNRSPRRHAWWLLVPIVLVGVLPYRVTAVGAQATHPTRPATSTPQPPPPPVPPSPPPPTPPTPPPPPPPPPPPAGNFSARSIDVDTDSHAANGYALFDGENYILRGSKRDQEQGDRLHQTPGSFLWFRRGDQGYVTHDATTIARAKAIFTPVTTIAREQGRLSGRLGELSGRQAAMAAFEGSLAAQEADLARQQAALARRSVGAGDAQQAGLDAERRAIEARHAQLDRQHAQREADTAQRQKELSEQQGALDRQMKQLDERQQLAQRNVDQAMAALLDGAVRDGVAKPVTAH